MSRRLIRTFSLLLLLSTQPPASAQDQTTPAAVLELLLPNGATAKVDGKAIDNPRSTPISDLKPTEIRRIKVAVKFADGATDERLVDVLAGQQLRVAVPQPGPEKAMVLGAHPLMPINSAAVSANGQYIALGLDARTIVVWDTTIGKPVRTLVGHQKPVLAVAFTPDSKRLLSASSDTTAILWDVETGTPLHTYKGHKGSIHSVAFAPDGKQFLTGSADKQAIVWDTDTGEQVHQLPWRRELLGVAYSPDGNMLATGSVDATAALWDAKTGKQLSTLRGHREDVNCVAFSPDGRRVVTGSSDDSSNIWDATTGSRIIRGGRHTNNIHAVAFTPEGRRYISGEREELVMMWDVETGANLRTFVGHGAEIFSIVPCLGGRAFLTGSRDGTARLWDLSTGRELLCLTTNGNGRAWAAVSSDGLFDGSEEGRRALGYRFPKGGFGEIEQFFAEGYRPGLLAEVWRGERPLPLKPLARTKPPSVKINVPKNRPMTSSVTLTADVTDPSGAWSGAIVQNNGIRLRVTTKAELSPDGKTTRFSFTVPLAPGSNRIGVRAFTRDGSHESPATEVEVSQPQLPGERGRLYVVAIGIGKSAKADATSLAELLRNRGGKLFERVDVIPVFDRDATKATIEDTVRDVAELSRPQDTLLVHMYGEGEFVGDRLHFANIAFDEIAAAMGTAQALNRALVLDASILRDAKKRTEFGFRGTVEQLGRTHGIHILASVAEANGPRRGTLTESLRKSAGSEKVDVSDWYRLAVERATASQSILAHSDLQLSTRLKTFPILDATK